MKIKRLRVSNYRGIEELDAQVPERGMVAAGRNGAGKTSVLRAIRAALAARDVSPDAIRLGHDRAEILVDVDDYTVRRVITAKGTSQVTIENAAGDRKAKPQTWLTQILGTSPLDPLDLYLADKKRRVEIVVGAMPTTLTEAQIAEWVPSWAEGQLQLPPVANLAKMNGLDACEVLRELFYARRTVANAAAKAAASELEHAQSAIAKRKAAIQGLVVPELADAEASVNAALEASAELSARAKRVETEGERFAKTRERIAKTVEAILVEKRWFDEAELPTVDDVEKAEQDVQASVELIRDLELRLENARGGLDATKAYATKLVRLRDEATDRELRIQQLQTERGSLEDALGASAETAPTSQEIAESLTKVVEAKNLREAAVEAVAIARAEAGLKTAVDELKKAETFAADLTKQVDFWRSTAPKKLLDAGAGIPGLRLEGEKILLDDVDIDALSGREQMRFAVEIARRANAATKILVVDGLERVDPEQRDAFIADATRDDWQLIATRVDRGDIVLEAIESAAAEAAQ